MRTEKGMQIFFEIHSGLPREGPGDSRSTKRAFALLSDLPPEPHVLDIGCGPGMQTLDLARLTRGQIVALDNHQPFLDELSARARRAGLGSRVQAIYGDMEDLPFPRASFDLIWAEGSIYIFGFEKGLRAWKTLLRAGGYLAVKAGGAGERYVLIIQRTR